MNTNPYQTPSSEITDRSLETAGFDTSSPFSPNGRFNRSRYIVYFFVTYLLSYFLAAIIAAIGMSVGSQTMASLVPIGVAVVLGIPAVILLTIYGIRRLHDMDLTGWLMILAFVPLINLFFFIVLMVNKGTAGVNRFGAPQKPSGPVMKVFAWIFGLILPIFILGILLAIAIPQYQEFILRSQGG